MFFVASKVLAFLVVPSNILIGLVIAGALLLYTRYALWGRRLIAAGLALIVIVGVSPVGLALLRVLEDRFQPWSDAGGAPAGFVVLGGALDPVITAARGTPALDGSAERLTIVAALARRYPQARFIYTGGNAGLAGGPAEADYVPALLASFGIARDRVVIEREARNTAENAAFSKALAAPKPGERWALVTSGVHMPRAIATFRAAGFDVEPFPVDWRTAGPQQALGLSPVLTAGLGAFDAAAREFIGLAVYRLTGRSAELLPSSSRR